MQRGAGEGMPRESLDSGIWGRGGLAGATVLRLRRGGRDRGAKVGEEGKGGKGRGRVRCCRFAAGGGEGGRLLEGRERFYVRGKGLCGV